MCRMRHFIEFLVYIFMCTSSNCLDKLLHSSSLFHLGWHKFSIKNKPKSSLYT